MVNIGYFILKEDRLFVIYPPGHPLASCESIYPEDLTGYPFILVNEGRDPLIRHFFYAGKCPNTHGPTVDMVNIGYFILKFSIGVRYIPHVWDKHFSYRRQLDSRAASG